MKRLIRIVLAASLGVSLTAGLDVNGQASPGNGNSGAKLTARDVAGSPDATSRDVSGAQEAWWESIRALCGQSFEGSLASSDAADDSFAGKRMVMHVRECSDSVIRIPFHVGEDRSRTWVLTRSARGIELEHDHRHADGSSDVLTMYGGDTTSPGTGTVQSFPADGYSKELFDAQGIPQSKQNVWSVEIVPGKRYSYVLRRPNRHFQVDFDLTRSVETPPAPWGHE